MATFLISIRRMAGRVVPSVSLDRYLIRLFAVNFVAVLCLLVAVVQTLSLLNTSDDILKAPGGSSADLIRFVMLQAPQYVTELAPFSALIAVLATLAALSMRNEITVMRSEGLSPYQLIVPLEIAAIFIALGQFALQELVVVDATRHLAAWEDSGFTSFKTPAQNSRRHVWLRSGDLVVKAEEARMDGTTATLRDPTVFRYGADGRISKITYAATARYDNHRWTLHNARVLDVASEQFFSIPTTPLGADIPPQRFMSASVHPAETSLAGLYRAVAANHAQGASAWSLETSLLNRFVAPLAALLMPLVGAMAGFGLPRQSGVWKRVAIGAVLGFSYFIAGNLTVAMGEAGSLQPVIAVLAPFVVFVLIGFGTLLRIAA